MVTIKSISEKVKLQKLGWEISFFGWKLNIKIHSGKLSKKLATKKQAKKKFGDKDSRIKSCRALSLLWPLESQFISEQSATTFLVEYFVEIFSLVRSVLIRRNQFNLLVYASDRPYFSKKKKIILQNFDILNFF